MRLVQYRMRVWQLRCDGERGGEERLLAAALEPAEAAFRVENPDGTPAFDHLAVAPPLHVTGRVARSRNHALDAVRVREARGESAAGTGRPGGEHALEAFAQARRRIGPTGTLVLSAPIASATVHRRRACMPPSINAARPGSERPRLISSFSCASVAALNRRLTNERDATPLRSRPISTPQTGSPVLTSVCPFTVRAYCLCSGR